MSHPGSSSLFSSKFILIFSCQFPDGRYTSQGCGQGCTTKCASSACQHVSSIVQMQSHILTILRKPLVGFNVSCTENPHSGEGCKRNWESVMVGVNSGNQERCERIWSESVLPHDSSMHWGGMQQDLGGNRSQSQSRRL